MDSVTVLPCFPMKVGWKVRDFVLSTLFFSFPVLQGCYKISIVSQSGKQKLPGYWRSILLKQTSFYLFLWQMSDILIGIILINVWCILEYLSFHRSRNFTEPWITFITLLETPVNSSALENSFNRIVLFSVKQLLSQNPFFFWYCKKQLIFLQGGPLKESLKNKCFGYVVHNSRKSCRGMVQNCNCTVSTRLMNSSNQPLQKEVEEVMNFEAQKSGVGCSTKLGDTSSKVPY